MKRFGQRVGLGIGLAALVSAPALATAINTGEAGGAYHDTLCPRLETALRQASFDYRCETSRGTGENLKRVLADPRQIGFGQLDVLALEAALTGSPPAITIMRRDDVRECLFAVTRNKEVNAYGDLAVHAGKLRFIMPPPESGSFATFRFLQSIDTAGLGRTGRMEHAATTDDAIRQALSADDTVTLFVQLPDPDNSRFKLVRELNGHFVPVIDRAILRQQVGGEKIYFAQETEVANAQWSRTGSKVVTACTPMAIFTGSSERVVGDKAQQDHRDLIATVRALRPDALVPAPSVLQLLWRRARELSAVSVEELIKLSEEAREKAGPLLERAKEAGGKAVEAAKELLEPPPPPPKQ